MVVKKYILNVDLMRRYSAVTPEFRRGDSGTLIFRVFNNGVEFDISRATKAEVYHETSMGTQIPTDCTFTTLNGKRVIQYDYEKIIMVELGFTKTMLVIYEGDTAVSIIPFNVWIYSDMKGGANSYLELIQDLGNQIEDLIMDLNSTIPQSEKGKPNGVASLDGSGKIPLAQMPKEVDSYLKHMDETVSEHHVHGQKPDADGLWMYQTANGDWQYFGYSDTAVGGGAPQVQLLEATIVVSNGIANITYTGTPTLATSKWATGTRDKTYFATNGTAFTGSSFVVAQLGVHTLFYRDSNGVEYAKVFAVTASMMNKPIITIDVEDGFVTITPPASPAVSIKKWVKGSQPISYFIYNGTTFTGNTFEITEVGTYTIYIKTSTGLEYVYEVNVDENMLGGKSGTPISQLPAGATIKFSGYDWILLNPTTRYVYKKESLVKRAFDTTSTSSSHITKFNLTSPNNLGYYLNTSFYNTLSEVDQSLIENYNWSINYQYGGYYNINMHIGIINTEEWENYSKKYNTASGILNNPSTVIMTSTPITDDTAYINMNQIAKDGSIINTYTSSASLDVHPTLHLTSDAEIDGNGNVFKGDSIQTPVINNVVPDIALRKALNSVIKGVSNDASTINSDQIESIKQFTNLTELNLVKSFEGLQYLTGAWAIRMSPNTLGQLNNIPDLSPIIELASKSSNLQYFNIYGVLSTEFSQFNVLKGKFPYLNNGGISDNGGSPMHITWEQLKNV